ncbi:MAG: rod shape-determining protein MreD [Porphyrobacter sp.]|jgi:rod shape-determining protein MreD|nr:rod shape-determining protein MreD [Porphyrobacter sp.]
MEQLNPRSRSDRYGSRINRAPSPLRAVSVPYLTIMAGSLLPTLLIADLMPLVPPLGFVMLLGWRIMRPGLLPVWIGAPLGAFDDLVSGQPFGSAVLMWSLAMIALELIEARFPWRGFWQDWFTAGFATSIYLLAALAASGAEPSQPLLTAMMPQAISAILIYPLVARFVAGLDRFRLTRTRRLA